MDIRFVMCPYRLYVAAPTSISRSTTLRLCAAPHTCVHRQRQRHTRTRQRTPTQTHATARTHARTRPRTSSSIISVICHPLFHCFNCYLLFLKFFICEPKGAVGNYPWETIPSPNLGRSTMRLKVYWYNRKDVMSVIIRTFVCLFG